MEQCAFYTHAFTRCKNRSPLLYCEDHYETAMRLGAPPEETQCACIVRNRWCGEPKQEGHDICATHAARIQARDDKRVDRTERFREEAALFQQLTHEYMTHEPMLSWQAVVRECHRRAERVSPKHPDRIPFKVATEVAKAVFRLRTHMADDSAAVYFWNCVTAQSYGIDTIKPPRPPLHLEWLLDDPPEWWKE